MLQTQEGQRLYRSTKAERRGGTGELKKPVIVSCHPVVAFIVLLWLRKLDLSGVAFNHADLRFKARQDLVNAFKILDDVFGRDQSSSFLVGTAGVMGVGLSLT